MTLRYRHRIGLPLGRESRPAAGCIDGFDEILQVLGRFRAANHGAIEKLVDPRHVSVADTVAGAESLAQAAFLEQLLRECRAREIHTAVDTSCYGPWEAFQSIAPYVDLFLCDLKHMDRAAQQRLTGVSNQSILQNVQRLAQLKKNIIIRIPVIPGANDSHENITATGG